MPFFSRVNSKKLTPLPSVLQQRLRISVIQSYLEKKVTENGPSPIRTPMRSMATGWCHPATASMKLASKLRPSVS